MEFLSEDATFLVWGLALAGLASLVALRVTQRGKFLVWGVGLLAGAGVVWAIESVWVTDRERIEGVVLDMARAVEGRDADRVLKHLAPEVTGNLGLPLGGPLLKAAIKTYVEGTRFDFIHISKLRANAGALSRAGTAEFAVAASGVRETEGPVPFAASNTQWSFGLRETSPGLWQVYRINAVSLPEGYQQFLTFRHE
jgi:ketosteroid isomerase-like protein